MATRKPSIFPPKVTITAAIANDLMRIEAVKQSIQGLPITPRVLANLREIARLYSTHYSTMIEGNRLTQQQVAQVIAEGQHCPGRERDQDEIRGYYAALDEVERLAKAGGPVMESALQRGPCPDHGDGQETHQADSLQGRPECHPRPPDPRHRLHAA